jgi:hypothetical protein
VLSLPKSMQIGTGASEESRFKGAPADPESLPGKLLLDVSSGRLSHHS